MGSSTHNVLSIWTIYDKPDDYPHSFVARRFEVRRGVLLPIRTADAIISADLEAVRSQLPKGLSLIPREAGDEPQIVESWC